ncbi:MAG TPA: YezD family protein [Chthoniobacteraceae bacterium]|jgi:hypothetical protein
MQTELVPPPSRSKPAEPAPALPSNLPPWLAFIAEKVTSLSYGTVQIVVHDSQVVQVERTERHRFELARRS